MAKKETPDPPEETGGSRGSDATDALDALQQELDDWKTKFLRARADYENLHKRTQETLALERDRVKARVLESFLQVYEYGQMAAFEAERNPGPLADGVKMVVREFDRLLGDEGVVSLGQAGESFDAALHEAVAEEPSEDIAPGKICRVIAPGYRLGDRVLRYAKVAISAGPAGTGSSGPDV